MNRLALFLLGIIFLPLGVLAQTPVQPNPYGEFLQLEDNKAQILKLIKVRQDDIEFNKGLIAKNIGHRKSNERAIERAQQQIDASIEILVNINAREKELISIINTDSFIITAPDKATARQINEMAGEAERNIRSAVLPSNSKKRAEDPKIKIMISLNKADVISGPQAGFRKVIATDFDDNGKPFQYTLCAVEVFVRNGNISSLDECKGSIRHELTHALYENEVRARLGGTKDVLDIPAALHEGLAMHMDNINMQNTMNRTLGWYPITKKKIPTVQELLIAPITATDYKEYAFSYGLASFLFTLDQTKEQSKYMDFTVRYLQTKDWNEAAKVYGFKSLDALNSAFQKWFQGEYSKPSNNPTLNLK